MPELVSQKKKKKVGKGVARETAPWLRVFVALERNPVQFSALTW